MADALQTAEQLREQARNLIGDWGLGSILERYGRVFYTGSYYLNTMVYPDLDIQILLDPEPFSIDAFFEVGSKVSLLKDVRSMKFSNFLIHHVDPLPVGLYWGVKTLIGSGERKWKIDLWAKDCRACEEHIAMMDDIRNAMDDKKRKLIVDIKHSLINDEGRTPVLSGYRVYQAVLFEGLTEREEIVAYLREKGISGV